MNFNAILAILQIRGIISETEAIAVAEHVAHAPQSTYYKDALEKISEVVKPTEKIAAKTAPILPQVKKATDTARQ